LVAEHVRRCGWHIEFVYGEEDDEETSFAYTVGLFGMGHPELLVFGISPHTAKRLLDDLGDAVQAGRDLVPGEVIDTRDGRRVIVEVVPNPGDIVFTANRHYDRPDIVSVPVLQLTWDDHGGRFPWDDDYSLPEWLQPRPGTFAA
jgi:hypothetical protein